MTLTITSCLAVPPLPGDSVNITTDKGIELTGTVIRANGAEALVAVGGRQLAFQEHEDRVWSWMDATPGPP